MCGILGTSEWTDETRALLPFMAIAMEGRGKDSWAATNGLQTIKHLGRITDKFVIGDFDEFGQAIFHTRAASVGQVTLENQHPFEFVKADGTRIVGVHNGHISNHAALNTKYNRTLAVDSAHVYAHMAADLPMSELHGWGALAWFEQAPSAARPTLHFARFAMQDFHVFKLISGPLVFCSTRTPIITMAQMLGIKIYQSYEFKPDQEYYVDENNDLTIGRPMVFGVAPPPPPADVWWDRPGHFQRSNTTGPTNTISINSIGAFSRGAKQCIACNNSVDRKKVGLCETCVLKHKHSQARVTIYA